MAYLCFIITLVFNCSSIILLCSFLLGKLSFSFSPSNCFIMEITWFIFICYCTGFYFVQRWFSLHPVSYYTIWKVIYSSCPALSYYILKCWRLIVFFVGGTAGRDQGIFNVFKSTRTMRAVWFQVSFGGTHAIMNYKAICLNCSPVRSLFRKISL